MNRQQKLLSVLLGLFVVALTYGVATYPRRERVTSGPPRGAIRVPELPEGEISPAIPAETGLPVVEEPQDGEEREAGVERNIFEPLFPVEVPPLPKVPGQGREGEAGPVVELLPPPPPFELLGYLQKDQDRIIFLTREDELFIVRPEERFGENDRYRIIEAEAERVVLEETGSGETTSLFFAAKDTGIDKGGRPFSPIGSRFQAPSRAQELTLPELPEDFDRAPEEPMEPDERPIGSSPSVPDMPTEAPERSPLAPGLIVPEESKNDVLIPEEDEVPSIDEVVDE